MSASGTIAAPESGTRTGAASRTLGLIALVVVLLVVVVLSIIVGARGVGLETIGQALLDRDPGSAAHTVVVDLRIPRTVLGCLVGAALALSGVLLQGSTRNPLADPGIMGINQGAAAFVVAGIMLLGLPGIATTIWLAFAGAAAAMALVYGVASFGREGATPVKLALAGAAVTAGLYAVTTGIVLTNVEALNELRFWQVGSLAGRYAAVVQQTAPFLLAGILLALAQGRALNGLALGEDVATALGVRVARTRALIFGVVAVLCGAAVAACGPIVFVGLVVPHVARMLCGPDYRWVLPFSLLIGPILLLACDILGRVLLPSGELQVGVVLGVLGAPVFIALVRFRSVAQL